MNLLNEHSLRFPLPAERYGTDQGVMEAFVTPGSSPPSLNFCPKTFHPPTYHPLVFATQVRGAGTISFDDS